MILNIEDLRVGNWLQSNPVSGLIGNFEICKSDLQIMIEESRDLSIYKPILITEEWLLKFGFDKHTRKDSSIINFHIVKDGFIYFTLFTIDIKKGLEFSGCKYKIKHVHQLQNLYFALTGDKLKVIKSRI